MNIFKLLSNIFTKCPKPTTPLKHIDTSTFGEYAIVSLSPSGWYNDNGRKITLSFSPLNEFKKYDIEVSHDLWYHGGILYNQLCELLTNKIIKVDFDSLLNNEFGDLFNLLKCVGKVKPLLEFNEDASYPRQFSLSIEEYSDKNISLSQPILDRQEDKYTVALKTYSYFNRDICMDLIYLGNKDCVRNICSEKTRNLINLNSRYKTVDDNYYTLMVIGETNLTNNGLKLLFDYVDLTGDLDYLDNNLLG